MKKTFHTDYNYNDWVCLKSDPENKRQVVGFLLRPGSVTIGVAKGDEETWHQPIELMKIKEPFRVKGFYGDKT
jgi:hypothetical protein